MFEFWTGGADCLSLSLTVFGRSRPVRLCTYSQQRQRQHICTTYIHRSNVGRISKTLDSTNTSTTTFKYFINVDIVSHLIDSLKQTDLCKELNLKKETSDSLIVCSDIIFSDRQDIFPIKIEFLFSTKVLRKCELYLKMILL